MLVLFLSFCESQDGDWLIYDKTVFYFIWIKQYFLLSRGHMAKKLSISLTKEYSTL